MKDLKNTTDFNVRLGVGVECRPNDSWRSGPISGHYGKNSPSFFMIKKYLILTFLLLVFVKFNENRKFLLSFFCVYKTQNGKHARFYINALLMQDLNMFKKF